MTTTDFRKKKIMNKKLFFTPLVAVAIAATFTACDEDAWNDHLDGYEDTDKNPTNVQTINYTLTDADYATVATANYSGATAADSAALKQIAAKKCFPNAEAVRKYLPAFLSNSSFPYFTLSDKSAVKVTYKIAEALPAELAAAADAQLYTVTEEDYMDVWESQEDYVPCFAPSHPASKSLPGILGENAEAGQEYIIASYAVSQQEPVFGNTGGGDTPEPEVWAPGNTIATYASGDDAEIKGYVTSVCAQGYTVTDNSGTIFVYMGSSFDPSSMQVGNQLNISGTIGAYNKGLQVTGSSATVEVVGSQAVTYPSATPLTGAQLDAMAARTDNALAQYVTVKGKAVVTERNINILVDGAEKGQGSVYQGTAAQKAMFTDGAEVTVSGYFIAVAAGRYCNIVVTSVNGKACAPRRAHFSRSAAAEVPSTVERALYHLDGNKWVASSNFVVLTPNDYTALGQQYQNLSNANTLLPKFLAQKFPYATAETVKNVLYLYYNSSDKSTYYVADQYTFNGAEWVLNSGVVEATDQFVRNKGVWNWDPSVVITLTAGKGQALSSTYYQACVDWVYENICVPLGDTSIKSGKFYVSSYGNNEYYSGTSAYQNNVDLRPSAARTQYPAEYDAMSDDEIVALEKKRFMNEVMPGALSKLHPDAVPVEGIEVTYTVNFSAYTGTTTAYTAVFKVVGPGKFEPVSCTWDN